MGATMLTQTEADTLIAMRKRFEVPRTITMPPGIDETYSLLGEDPRERFLLDLWRGTLRLSKLRLQTRGRTTIVLIRLDVDGAPHTNPDGQRIAGTHIHRYREGFEDKWAEPLDPSDFGNLSDREQVYLDFCRLCTIDDPASLQRELL
jgi:hypothetical protein